MSLPLNIEKRKFDVALYITSEKGNDFMRSLCVVDIKDVKVGDYIVKRDYSLSGKPVLNIYTKVYDITAKRINHGTTSAISLETGKFVSLKHSQVEGFTTKEKILESLTKEELARAELEAFYLYEGKKPEYDNSLLLDGDGNCLNLSEKIDILSVEAKKLLLARYAERIKHEQKIIAKKREELADYEKWSIMRQDFMAELMNNLHDSLENKGG